MRHHTFWLLGILTVLALTLPTSANQNDAMKITVEPNQNLRAISQKYLNNPDLWEDILRANNLNSAADVKPGMELIIPVKQISTAHKKLDRSGELIHKATKAGAKIFATESITIAIDQRNVFRVILSYFMPAKAGAQCFKNVQ